MLDLNALLSTYKAIKAHDNEIMSRRPAGHPSADWRMQNPHGQKTAFRIYRDGKEYGALLNCDTAPVLQIWSGGERRSIVENIDLRADDAPERLAYFTLPLSSDMTAPEFAAIRKRLGLTQAQLAPLLDIALAVNISAYERASNPRPIPTHIARIMNAMDAGWRPTDWPLS